MFDKAIVVEEMFDSDVLDEHKVLRNATFGDCELGLRRPPSADNHR